MIKIDFNDYYVCEKRELTAYVIVTWQFVRWEESVIEKDRNRQRGL